MYGHSYLINLFYTEGHIKVTCTLFVPIPRVIYGHFYLINLFYTEGHIKVTYTFCFSSVAQLDARPTGYQEVAGSTLAGTATFLPGDLIMKYILRSLLPFADSRRTVVSFWRKKVHNTD